MTSAITITQQTINDLCHCLAFDVDLSIEQITRLQNESDYLPLVSLANKQWVLPSLVFQLQRKKVWQFLPQQLQSYLTEINEIHQQRNAAIKHQVISCCELLLAANYTPLLLKGAASLFNGVADSIGGRFMADVDILLLQAQAEDAHLLMQQNGYTEIIEPFAIRAVEHHHLTPLKKENSDVCFELHRSALNKEASMLLTDDDIWREAQLLSLVNERDVKQLSLEHQLVHTILHSQISDKNFQNYGFDLKQIYDIYGLCQLYRNQIDWQIVTRYFASIEMQVVLDACMYMLKHLFLIDPPIVPKCEERALMHCKIAINRYLSHQGVQSNTQKIVDVFKGYEKNIIFYHYGRSGYFPLLVGRLKHLYRHLKIIISWFLKRRR